MCTNVLIVEEEPVATFDRIDNESGVACSG
jgi:hypothetical protein